MKPSPSPVIGETIKYLRTEAGMLQGELARRINKTQTIVSCIESGKARPSLSTVKASADNEKVIEFIFEFFKR